MSDILHIKDAYYFDVPKFLWRRHYTSLDEVPQFLRDGHPHATVADFNRELSGKVLIPQPFGTLKNLYEKESGFALSKFMILEVVVAVILSFLFIRLAAQIKAGKPTKGKLSNLLEGILVYMRDHVAKPAIGGHDYGKFTPLLWTMFFFVLGLNLLGLVPWAGSATGSFSVTLALAGITFATVLISGMAKFGPVGFWLNQVPHMDLPWYCQPLKLVIFAIEVAGMFIRHGVLAIRLLANMVAGHLVLLAILGLAFSAAGAASSSWHIAAPIAVVGSAAFSLLELFVAFLQAYVFTFLSALFIGAAIHHH
jgi:F-type H+-transporting ATPase subunit a